MTGSRDVVIVGGGHNALAAAAYLAQAGLRVTVLERLDELGGAAVSVDAFAGLDARVSRYAYLVSLLPARIIADLRLDVRLVRRRYSSYTPRPGTNRGVLIDRGDPSGTGLGDDASGWRDLARATELLARRLFPTMTMPLLTRGEARRTVDDDAVWSAFVEEPVGAAITRVLEDDVLRGIALTDALIGNFVPNLDASLAGNACFLYHVIGGGTGDWDVPLGGMGAVTGELRRAALEAGAELRTGTEVTSVDPDGEVVYLDGDGDGEHRLAARWVVAGCSPAELSRLLGEAPPAPAPEGAQVKTNMLVSRLPRLRDPLVDPRTAFSGTFHVNETWSQFEAAYASAERGEVPDPLPLEVYSHTLADPSILGRVLQDSGAQTLTVFGLHTPHRLAGDDPEAYRRRLERAVLDSIDSVLAEPIESLLLTDAEGRPTIETRTTSDLVAELRLPGGHIMHGAPEMPWARDGEELATAAARWGVATAHERILLCGSGARRGGLVSAIGGHNAAHAILEAL